MIFTRPRTLYLWVGLAAGATVGCGGSTGAASAAPEYPEATVAPESLPASTATESTPSPDGGSVIDAALRASHRSEENRARDVYRHPRETLDFFGVSPGTRVVELSPGAGWYTEILAPVICQGGGTLYATMPDPAGPNAKYAKAVTDKLASAPDVFDCVEPIVFDPPAQPSLGADGSVDMVLTFRSTHGFINHGQAEAVYRAAFAVLKPGGVLGVVQHRADEGKDATITAKTGYVPEAYVIELAQAAGFTLAGKSDVNRNPKDSRNHPEGVWTLPPVLRLGDTDRDKYMQIGESDRMTLKFIKPATAP